MVTGTKDGTCGRGVVERTGDGRATRNGRGIELGAAEWRAVGDGGGIGPRDDRRGRGHVDVHRGGRARVVVVVRGEIDIQGLVVAGTKDGTCVRGVVERAEDGRAARTGRGVELGAAEFRAVGDGGWIGPRDDRRGRGHVDVHRGGRVRVAGVVRGEENMQGLAVAGTKDGTCGRGVDEVAQNTGRGVELGAAERHAVDDGCGVGPGDGRDVKHLDVGPGRVGVCRHRRADALIGREVARSAVQVAAVDVGPSVFTERNRVVVVWHDSQHIGPVAVRAGPNA